MNYDYAKTQETPQNGKRVVKDGTKNCSTVGNPILMNGVQNDTQHYDFFSKPHKRKGEFHKDLYKTTGNFQPECKGSGG